MSWMNSLSVLKPNVFACLPKAALEAANSRGELFNLPLQACEEHVRARAAHQIGVERGRAAAARGGECFRRLLQLPEARVDVVQFPRSVAAAPPEARDHEHESKDQNTLSAEREAHGDIPMPRLVRRKRPA